MPDNVYEVVAQGARYWFILLMAMIVWRSFRWLRRDARQRAKRLRLLPDAGYVGEMIVLRGGNELKEGDALPLPREGVLGCLRMCDLYVPVEGVKKKHLWFAFDEYEGLMVEPFFGTRAVADGAELTGSRQRAYLRHGSRLTVGEAELRMRLFSGFEGAGRAGAPISATIDDEPADMTVGEETPQAAAMTPEQMREYMRVLAQNQLALQMQLMRKEKTFYPPVTDEDGYDYDGEIEYQGYDPEYMEGGADDDETGAGAPDKEDYVGADEAARAKGLVWDRLLGRRRRS